MIGRILTGPVNSEEKEHTRCRKKIFHVVDTIVRFTFVNASIYIPGIQLHFNVHLCVSLYTYIKNIRLKM